MRNARGEKHQRHLVLKRVSVCHVQPSCSRRRCFQHLSCSLFSSQVIEMQRVCCWLAGWRKEMQMKRNGASWRPARVCLLSHSETITDACMHLFFFFFFSLLVRGGLSSERQKITQLLLCAFWPKLWLNQSHRKITWVTLNNNNSNTFYLGQLECALPSKN